MDPSDPFSAYGINTNNEGQSKNRLSFFLYEIKQSITLSNECKEGGEAMQEKELLQLIRKARSKDPDAFSSLIYFYMNFDRVIDVNQVQSLLFRIHAGDSPEKYISVDLK